MKYLRSKDRREHAHFEHCRLTPDLCLILTVSARCENSSKRASISSIVFSITFDCKIKKGVAKIKTDWKQQNISTIQNYYQNIRMKKEPDKIRPKQRRLQAFSVDIKSKICNVPHL